MAEIAEQATSSPVEVKKCSKKGCTNPRADVEGSNGWCLPCRAEYMRGYRAGQEERFKDSGFGVGAEAMRRALLAKLGELNPAAPTNFHEMTNWIRDYPAPRP